MENKVTCVICWDLENLPEFLQEPLEDFYFDDFIEDEVKELTSLVRSGIILPIGTTLEIYSRDLDNEIKNRLEVEGIRVYPLFKITGYEYRFCCDMPLLMVSVITDIEVLNGSTSTEPQ